MIKNSSVHTFGSCAAAGADASDTGAAGALGATDGAGAAAALPTIPPPVNPSETTPAHPITAVETPRSIADVATATTPRVTALCVWIMTTLLGENLNGRTIRAEATTLTYPISAASGTLQGR